MSFSELMIAGIQLMFVGMGIVFTFLAVLVATMNGMSRLAISLGGAPAAADAAPAGKPAQRDEALIAVISAAIRRYRDTR